MGREVSTKRVFVCIDIPEQVKEKIKEVQKNLPAFVGKKTEFENLHLTLKFLGHLERRKIEEVKKRLEKVRMKKFEASLGPLGVFSEQFIRIVWIKIFGCDALQKAVDDSLKGLFEPEARFMSHLTIARVKKVDNRNFFLEKLRKMEIPKISFEVDCFRLKESVLNPEGPRYFDMKIYPLE